MSTSQSSGTFGYPDAIRLFEDLASSTWDWLADAKRLGLGFSEDTVSDLNMLQIARSQINEVKVGGVTKGQERFVGFDWMWLISEPGVGRAIYVVQAKKMRLDNALSYAYGSLRYPHNPPFQIDMLQDFADSLGALFEDLLLLFSTLAGSLAPASRGCSGLWGRNPRSPPT